MYFLLVLFVVILFILPERYSSYELDPEHLLTEVIDETRFVTTDYISEKIIESDPYVLLIDVRSPEDFKKFSLKGAINIPLQNLLDKDDDGNYIHADILNQRIRKNVFYSNGNVFASQAWVITARLNYENNYVMKGGLNLWVETIMRPKKPKTEASQTEFDLYEKRKAAAMFFGGGSVSIEKEDQEEAPPTVVNTKKKEVAEEEGGC